MQQKVKKRPGRKRGAKVMPQLLERLRKGEPLWKINREARSFTGHLARYDETGEDVYRARIDGYFATIHLYDLFLAHWLETGSEHRAIAMSGVDRVELIWHKLNNPHFADRYREVKRLVDESLAIEFDSIAIEKAREGDSTWLQKQLERLRPEYRTGPQTVVSVETTFDLASLRDEELEELYELAKKAKRKTGHE